MKNKIILFFLTAAVMLTASACGKTEQLSTKNSTPDDTSTSYYTALGFESKPDSEQIPAFLGADGFGKYTAGGRGGKVIEVTNLNDSGEGSLRAAVESSGPRTIVFRISGNIYLNSMLTVTEPYVTIAGQTAPGDGICLVNYGLTVNTHDAVVRYIRSRPGGDYETDAVWVKDSQNVVIDHMSTSWGTDETLSVSGSDMVSIQYCLISESLNNNKFGTHGMGSLVRGSNGQNVTFHNNVYASHRSRLPMCGNYTNYQEDPVGFNFEFINNVIYNWSGQAAGKNHDTDSITKFNLINNYYLSGPASENNYIWSEGCSYTKMYAAGNAIDQSVPEDPWSGIEIESDNTNFSWENYKLTERFQNTQMDDIKSPEETYTKLMETVGASKARDAVDTAIIDSIQNKKGKIINKPEQSVGWSGEFPVLNSTAPFEDSDHDGMADDWETANDLNPDDSKDASAVTSCGYTNLEIFLEYLIQTR